VAKGDFKADPRAIIRAHWRTLADARTGRPMLRDWLEFTVPPLLVGGLCGAFDVQLGATASAGLLTVTGLLSAFLFGVVVQMSSRAMEFADRRPVPSRATSDHATFVEELAANAGYAFLVSVAAAVVFVLTAITTHLALRVTSAIGLAITVHLAMVLLMVVKRVFALTQQQLQQARSGADREERAARRRAS
jgi:hypothetical protein